MKLITSAAIALMLCAAPMPAPALAQAYPTKAVRIILPYLGGTDFVGRFLAAKLAPRLGQQVIVDPRLGAGGNIGHEATAKATPDGYTLMLASTPFVLNPILNSKSAYDLVRDFAPIELVATLPNVLAVHPSVPARTLRELVQLARANPGKLAYGSGTVGSTSHLAGELLKSLSKANILLVPYKGATFALVGAMSGEVDVVIPAASAVEPYVKSNRMRVLAVLDGRRLTSMPDVPTSAEAGLPQLLIVNWYVLTAPAATPRAIIERLNAEAVKIMQAPETRTYLAGIGGEPISSTPEQAAAFLRAEFERWAKVIRAAGIKAE
ncbi:MAG TPA: tripartite tricarboxylate transporter substrate binding protein [Steroidobacteraceae bacterium]|nr:tripartite tricarboxylate transporter substrate binding protein [Steroidobacteraceae bacterium]